MVNKVFFLGAGFSKAVNDNYPLMDELTKQVFEGLEKESVRKHLDEIPEQVKQNIESLLTYLSTDFPWKTETTKHANLALYASIVQIISDIFTELAKQDISKFSNLPWRSCKSFARTLRRNASDVSIITLNYDLLLEQLMRSDYAIENKGVGFISCSFFYPYPMTSIYARSGAAILAGDPDEEQRFPHILKLHGSANWFWAGMTPSDILYYRQWHKEEPADITKGLVPYIIPPVLDKNAFYNHIAIRSLWQQAAQLLEKADEIYIIGFSFPQTDLAVKYLFQSALRNSEPDIYVVNRAKEDELRSVYQDVLQGQRVNYEYIGSDNVVEQFISKFFLTDSFQ